MTTRQHHRLVLDARLAAGVQLTTGQIVEVPDATRLLKLIVRSSDRACREGDNQGGVKLHLDCCRAVGIFRHSGCRERAGDADAHLPACLDQPLPAFCVAPVEACSLRGSSPQADEQAKLLTRRLPDGPDLGDRELLEVAA